MRSRLRRPLLIALCLATCTVVARAQTPERAAILDAVRPVASRLANQPVRIVVERVTQDRGWAILVGELVSPSGRRPDWARVDGCDDDLDTLLWAVLRKVGSTWRVRHIVICATEPPYWDLEPYGGLVWPCGVYAGLVSSEGVALEGECRRQRRRSR